MTQGAYPAADVVARGWLAAVDANDEGVVFRMAMRTSAPIEVLHIPGSQWVLFQALRAAWPFLTWGEAARMSGLDYGLDLGDLGFAIGQDADFWPKVQRVFAVLMGPGR